MLLCDYRPHSGHMNDDDVVVDFDIFAGDFTGEYQHRSNNNIKNFTELKNKIDGKCSIKFYEQAHYRNT